MTSRLEEPMCLIAIDAKPRGVGADARGPDTGNRIALNETFSTASR